MLENAEAQKKIHEKRCEEMAQRLRETERNLHNSQDKAVNYKVPLQMKKNKEKRK